jgi:hypothetical protein
VADGGLRNNGVWGFCSGGWHDVPLPGWVAVTCCISSGWAFGAVIDSSGAARQPLHHISPFSDSM